MTGIESGEQNMQVPLLDLKAQYRGLREEIRRTMDAVCDEQAFILGEEVAAFERETAAYCRVQHAIGVSSGTDALLVALMALDVKPGDAVITSPYSFFATAGSIARLGATPVFVDIDPETFNIDPQKVEEILEAFKQKHEGLTPKVLLPVHLYGQAADMDPLLNIAEKYALRVVEDAAQAIGAEYPSRKGKRRVGGIGDIGCFSFFPSKNLGGFGDGGMVTANDPELAEKIRTLRVHGGKTRYEHDMIGGNFRLDALQAAVLRVKLPHLDGWHRQRRRNADRYDAVLGETDITCPKAVYRDGGVENYHIYNQYVVRVPDRDGALDRLRAADIGCAIYYPIPLHLQQCFCYLGYHAGDFPVAEAAAKETLALPVYPELTEEMQECVVKTLLG